MAKVDRYATSRAYLERASKTLAGGVSSNVRRGDKPLPLYFDHAKGAHLWDVDGNRYIDYVLGRGPLILGHGAEEVIEATCRQLERGQIYAAQHPLEFELSERICKIVPCAERVRFGISGSEAVHGALRLARAATGRKIVLKFEGQYHGWLDNILYSLAPHEDAMGDALHPNGVQESRGQFTAAESHVVVLPWNNIAVLEEHLAQHAGEIAAIITEPIMANTAVIPPLPGYLERVRELCTQYGIVLIFDEVIAGFRASLAGAQGRFGIKPDLTIFGKAIANGLPISCIAGRADLMDLIGNGSVGHGGTYNSIPPAVAAAVATLDILAQDDGAVYKKIEKTGQALMDGIRKIGERLGIPLIVQGYGALFYIGFPLGPVDEGQAITNYRTALKVDQEKYNSFVSALADRGVRVIPRGNWFLSSAHSPADVAETLEAVEASLIEVCQPAAAVALGASK
ncbi:aspartate aminotransferase family protein [Edaphobacter flagellatus]|uniref:aspartate aminotransferase family protein n=1 Tax=Edaphobacter flagellatus TaxID=1933044 RepID=UPI0021B1FFE4|nr:aspartate aminotransferase family protein [Edaphobacter flagellatus]